MQLAAIVYSWGGWGSRPTQQAARPRHSVNDKLDRDSLPLWLLCTIRAPTRTVATLSGPERELCGLFDLCNGRLYLRLVSSLVCLCGD